MRERGEGGCNEEDNGGEYNVGMCISDWFGEEEISEWKSKLPVPLLHLV